LYCISPVADMTYIERSARTVGAVSRSFLSARFSVGRRCIATEQYRVSFLILIKKTQSRLSAVIYCSVISHDGAEVAVRRLVRNSYIIFIYLFIFCNFTYVWSLSAPAPPERVKSYRAQLMHTPNPLEWSLVEIMIRYRMMHQPYSLFTPIFLQ